MVDTNKSHITLLCDRTGSMSVIKNDAEGAVNAFIEEQKKLPNPCTMLLAEFDAPMGILAEGQFPWFHIVHDGDLADTPKYSLRPRGNTALYDAMGQAIVVTGERLSALPEAERPGHVFMVIQTDGQENSSRDWSLSKLIEAIKTHEDQFSWTFIFLGTGPDAFATGQSFQGTRMSSAHTVGGSGTAKGYGETYSYVSSNVAATRGGAQGVVYGGKVDDEGNVTPDADGSD